MKKVGLLVIIFLVSFSSFAFASSSQSETKTPNEVALPDDMPVTISLLDTTPLYPEPDDALETWAEISPQDVTVLRIQYGENGYASPSGYTWIQINTWLGDMWIKVENRKLGVIRPFTADLSLAVETPLYERPYREAVNGARLAPQTVQAKAEFVSPSGFYAIQIETFWLGSQWLIQPEIEKGTSETYSFPDAVNLDLGELMTIHDIQIINLGGRTFVRGQLVLQERAWAAGRLNLMPGEYPVSGKLCFWNETGDVIAQAPYTVYSQSGKSMSAPLLLPVDNDLSSAVLATLRDTFPFYLGLPVPPSLNLTDPEGKVLVGILRQKKIGDYTIAKAWISGKLPGYHDYKLTLTFYGEDNHTLGSAQVHQRMKGPESPDQASAGGGGIPYLIDVVGKGDWTNYHRVTIHVDQVSDENP